MEESHHASTRSPLSAVVWLGPARWLPMWLPGPLSAWEDIQRGLRVDSDFPMPDLVVRASLVSEWPTTSRDHPTRCVEVCQTSHIERTPGLA